MTYCLMWDFDHTLAYRNGMWTKSLCSVLDNAGYGGKYDENIIKNAMRTGLPWHFANKPHAEYFNDMSWWGYVDHRMYEILKDVGIKDDAAKELALRFKDEYLRLSEWFLFDDTIKALEHSVDRGYDNLIISNHTPELDRIVEYLGIDKYFKSVISSALIGYEKPHQEIFNHAKSLCPADFYIMIGDNYMADVKGALECGIDAILVRKDNMFDYDKYSKTLEGIWKYIV